MAKGDSLADQLFNRESVLAFAIGFEQAGVFDAEAFTDAVIAAFPRLELKARINHIAAHLGRVLPRDFRQAATAIRQGMPAPLDPSKRDDDFGHFTFAALGVYVENQGLKDHFESSLDLIEDITKRFSMEFSLRAFLNHNQTATLEKAHHWTQNSNYHVRRLASEGTRPKLPWGQNVGLIHDDTLPILDALHADKTRFVTRSVANHLNDIAKTEPEAVLSRLDAWAKSQAQDQGEHAWMRKHALRTLIKSGHAGAMAHLGYASDIVLKNVSIAVPERVNLGDKPKIDVTFTPQTDGPLIVDYVIDFMKSNGKTSAKTFKMKGLEGKAYQPIELSKAHHFDGTATTFKLYAGAHCIHLQINGRKVASQAFHLA